jgi:DNA-binding SARP family transcriptional activator
MTALYRSGRQAEALDAYQDARRALVDGLGIEPSSALQELERAILRHDRALDVEAPAPSRAGEAGERSILVSLTDETRVDALLAVAERLVREPRRATEQRRWAGASGPGLTTTMRRIRAR